MLKKHTSEQIYYWFNILKNIIYAGIVIYFLTQIWMPLGVNKSLMSNFSFIAIIVILLLSFFQTMIYFYENILRFCLQFKFIFFVFPAFILFFGYQSFQQTEEEFMPALNEGSFLLMPTSMPHSGMQENLKNLRMLDMAVTTIPEIENVVGVKYSGNSILIKP